MKVAFVSNYYNHHQKPFCEAMYALLGDEFVFISTSQMREERKKLGYGEDAVPPYVKYTYTSPEDAEACRHLIDAADAVLVGSAPETLLTHRKKEKKLIIRYAERPLKKGNALIKYIPRFIQFHRRLRGKNQYLLCSSAYTYADFQKFALFRNRAYKWGYFPQTIHCDLPALMEAKNKQKILWCGRFLDWKHPDDAIRAAKMLHDANCDFELDMIGAGPMEEQLKAQIAAFGLENKVHLLGTMKPDQVRQHMERAGIYLFTSDFNEGWGAVLNEAMNSGCAVVASHAIGAVPYLLQNGENGYIYQSGNRDTLFHRVKYLLEHPLEQERLGTQAYQTIAEAWNAEVAAERFLRFVEEIAKHGSCDLFKNSPCSKAEIIRNDWFDHVK